MIRKKKVSDDTMEVTFILAAPIEGQTVSVVGDFNAWQPSALHFEMKPDNTFAATTTLPVGRQYAFRYLTAHGRWFDEDAADGFQPNEYGSGNCLLYT